MGIVLQWMVWLFFCAIDGFDIAPKKKIFGQIIAAIGYSVVSIYWLITLEDVSINPFNLEYTSVSLKFAMLNYVTTFLVFFWCLKRLYVKTFIFKG